MKEHNEIRLEIQELEQRIAPIFIQNFPPAGIIGQIAFDTDLRSGFTFTRGGEEIIHLGVPSG